MYPIIVNLAGKRVVIVGGGNVALRKVRTLLSCGATTITVIAPEISNEIPPQATRVVRNFEPTDLDGAALVFAATSDRQVNDAVTREAHARGIFVNRADAEEDSDFATPAISQDDALLVAVSTHGNPALSVKIRDLLLGSIDDKWKRLARFSTTLRPQILQRVTQPELRREIFRALATEDAADHASDETSLLRWVKSRFRF